MRYAGFWRRSGALLVDFAVLAPFLTIPFLSRSLPTPLHATALILVGALGTTYVLYCHGRYGQTIGKRLMRIRVYLVDGSPITWRAAWRRHAPDVAISIFGIYGMVHAASGYLPSEAAALTLQEWGQRLTDQKPLISRWADAGSNLWTWSELVVLLFNRQRRALHDFLGGTVVLHTGNQPTSN